MAERSATKKIVLIVVLAITLATVLFVQFGGLSFGSGTRNPSRAPSPNSPAGESAGPTVESTPAPPAKVQIAWKRPDPIGPIIRDPMRMDLQGALRTQEGTDREPNDLRHPAEQPQFRVTGIVFSTEQPSSVIIDGRIFHEGDTVHGATVAKISENYAELRRGDKSWTIKAGQSNPEPEQP